ncbi:MAG: hypothetical protein JW863_03910 [Chitinispirillaceae bacterium]|nr:hypothetical protein [Chitinispirillaceae bacterium]
MKSLYLTFSLIVLLFAYAFSSPVDIMIGARGYGFGGAYSAIVDDPSAAYWNPAALGCLPTISLMESNWIFQDFTGLNVNYLSLGVPLPYVGTIGGSWLMKFATLEQGGIDGTITSHRSSEHLFSLSLGRRLWEKLGIFYNTSLGVSVNRYTFLTNDGDGAGIGFDLGMVTGFPYGFKLAVVGRNLGSDFMDETIDPEVRWGIGYSITLQEMHRITAAVDGLYKMNRDYTNSNDYSAAENNIKYFGGIEYALLWKGWEFAMRGGGNGTVYSSLPYYGFAAGVGIKFLGYSLQYAFKGDTDTELGLGYSHRADVILELTRLKSN